MLDLRYILDHIEEVRENTEHRKMKADFERLAVLANQRSALIQEIESRRQRKNEIDAQMRSKLSAEERTALVEEGKQLKQQVSDLEQQHKQTEQELQQIQMDIPNISHPDVPRGAGEDDNAEVKRWGEKPTFGGNFRPKDHVEIGEQLGLIDWEGGSKVTGSKFYFLRNGAVWLELALVHYALSILEQEGFAIYTTPDMARQEILSGIGFNPRGSETQIYSIANTDLALIATAEITLGGMLAQEILDASRLPLLVGGLSHCFRTEAGAPGKASRGLYRVHQFTKVEMFAFTTPEESDPMLERFLDIEEQIFQGLEIPYRVVDCCTGDLGAQAYRKYDIEAWMPGRGEEGEYGEVTSASNCTDYQSRRLMIRYRPEGKGKPRLVHTLNGTALATSRAIIAVLENYQQPDGSVVVPEVLRPWMGRDRLTL